MRAPRAAGLDRNRARGGSAIGLALSLLGLWPSAVRCEEPPELRLGVMVEQPADPARIIGFYSDLIAQLRAGLEPAGIRVPEIVIARDLEDLSGRLRDGRVDFIIETVFASQLLRDRSGNLEPGLVVVRNGRRQYASVFITRRDSEVRSLEDLRGKVLVLEAPRSTSAFALPQAELARHGLELKSDDAHGSDPRSVRYLLAGAELNQAVWVAHGRGDAAAFGDGDWEALPTGLRDQLRVFHRTHEILRGLVSFRKDLDPDVRARSEELMLRLHEDPRGKAAMAKARITRMERLTDRDRAVLAAWESTLRSLALVP